MLFSALYAIPAVLFVAFVLIMVTVKIVRQYERAVVFTLGRFEKVKGPGLVLLIPLVQEMVRVDLRIQVLEIPSQDVISGDNVSMKVDAVLYFNVVDPERAVIQVQSFLPATVMLAQTTLRAVLGQHALDEMLSERKKLSSDVQSILDVQTETWCASRSAAISYGKGPGFRLVLARSGALLRGRAGYGVLSWRATRNARHVSDPSGILHAINRVAILGVDMACNATKPRDASPARLAADLS